MESDFINILLGFIEGFSLIFSPCILPILPIFLAGSLTGSKNRPYGIILGFTIFFALIAFFSRQLVQYSGIDLNLIRQVSFTILILLGLIMLSDFLSEKITRLTHGLTKLGAYFSSANQPQAGFFNGILFGGLIAIVWTPCAGPILASVIVQTVLQKTTLVSFFILLAFALGAGIPMLIITLYGSIFINNFQTIKNKPSLIRKVLGITIILSVAFMLYLENLSAAPTQEPQTQIKTTTALEKGVWFPYPAPAIEGISAWINSPPLTINELKGKVVLIDFWTYSCINCIRTLPYLKAWYQRYHDKGLVIIGVHSPEFSFERKLANVQDAVKRYGIKYPVALDNHFATWRNYKNHYWPAHYLINKQGMVVYEHFGEGQYAVTENNIRFLLGIKGLSMNVSQAKKTSSFRQTPETYLGYQRADPRYSPKLIANKISKYHFPSELKRNAWALAGSWLVNEKSIQAQSANASINIHFNAKKVFMVMGNDTDKPVKLKVLLNGKRLLVGKGKDVKDSSILVNKHSIYEVVSQKQFGSGYLQVTATEPGVVVYTYTFGG